jgi:hypothetical protein
MPFRKPKRNQRDGSLTRGYAFAMSLMLWTDVQEASAPPFFTSPRLRGEVDAP